MNFYWHLINWLILFLSSFRLFHNNIVCILNNNDGMIKEMKSKCIEFMYLSLSFLLSLVRQTSEKTNTTIFNYNVEKAKG